MDSDVLHAHSPFERQNFNTEPIRSMPPGTPSRQTDKLANLTSAVVYPSLLVIDADEERAQRLARMLTLANYHPLVTTNPVNAFKRSVNQPMAIQAILLGQISSQHQFCLNRNLQQLNYRQRINIPVISLPRDVPNKVPLYANSQVAPYHIASQSCLQLLEALWQIIPNTRSDLKLVKQSMVSRALPANGVQPRVAQLLRSRSSHFRQVLQAAHNLMPIEQWETLIGDVGLAQYRRQTDWPSMDDAYAIPVEYYSCLNQAVAFSRPENPIEQLRRWGTEATSASLEKNAPTTLMQSVLKLATPSQVIRGVLKAYTREMDEIRGEPLHEWIPLPNGNYWLVHFSNLYAYGRAGRLRSRPMCHVWLASIEATLRKFHLDTAWKAYELECSCQTQTGHCLFGLQQL